MASQTVLMRSMFYDYQLAAWVFVCVGSRCLPAVVSARIRWMLCDCGCARRTLCPGPAAVSSHDFNLQDFKSRAAHAHLKLIMSFESSNLPGAGPAFPDRTFENWIFVTGGCSGRGVQWMGVVLCNKLVSKYYKSLHPVSTAPPL